MGKLRDAVEGVLRVLYWEWDRFKANYREGYGSGINPFTKAGQNEMRRQEQDMMVSLLDAIGKSSSADSNSEALDKKMVRLSSDDTIH